jgi:4-amino-4-deoxy-L-arabinose transferase-like glycosyltransferase
MNTNTTAAMADERGALGSGVPSRRLLALLAVAALLRAVWALMVPVMPVSDSHAYDTFARTLVSSGVFGWNANEPFSFWPPGTSLIYAALFHVFGAEYNAIVCLNLLLSVGLIVLTMRLATRFYGARCALYSGWVLALWPTLVMFTTVLASELPFLVFVTAALDVWTLPNRRAIWRGAAAGALLGCAALVRPVAMALPVIIGVAVLLDRGLSKSAVLEQLRVVVPALIAMACVIAPWTMRNYALYHEVVLISTNGGVTLWMGNAPGTTGEHMNVPAWAEKLRDDKQDKALGELAKSYILNDPVGFAWRSLRKFIWLYNHESIGVAWNEAGLSARFGESVLRPLKLFTHATWALIFMTSFAGLLVLIKARGFWRAVCGPVVVTIAFYSAIHSAVVSQDRYHLEFAVQIALLAGVALNALFVRWRSGDANRQSPPATDREPSLELGGAKKG